TLPLPKATSPTYTNGLQKPTTLQFAPDGKIFVAERNGRVMELDSLEDQTPTLVLSILDKVMAKGDRGILGMKLDPEYPAKPYLYLSYTYDAPIGGDSADSTHTHLADGADDCQESNNAIDCLVSGRLARVKIDPVTSVAVGGPVDPTSEEVLINSWCQQATSHSIGDIEFDSEGALLMSGGEGASWGSIDYGQLGNPCNDPPFEGGSLRAQDLRTPATAGDPTDYSGSIIRVNRETGAAMPNNPLVLSPLFANGVEDVAARRILAEGLRNPYRFTLQPGTGELYVGDVGQDRWEEINHLTPPPVALNQGLTNFGWPCYEGGRPGNLVMPRWQAAEGEIHQPLCEALYSNPSQVTAPLFAYPHPKQVAGYDGHLFDGDACDPEAGSAVAGLAFYDPTGIPAENAFPAEYDGALFFSDAARGCIWTMLEGLNGAPDPATVANFAVKGAAENFTPVDIVEGPEGALYVPNFYGDSIVQIRYFPGNQAPTAQLTADKTFGPAPLSVKFDASGSTDPDLGSGDTIHYAWDTDGDGEFDDGTGSTAEAEYTQEANVTAKVRVSDDFGHSDVAEVKLYPGDLGPPQVTIEAPLSTLEWEIGETIDYAATATDPDGETFGAGLVPHWEFLLEHCPAACHEHPITSADSPSGSFVAPAHEFPSHLKLIFTATDSRGMTDVKEVEIYPRLVEVGVSSDPAGVTLGLEGVTSDTPFSTTMMAGGTTTVSAPLTATIDGQEYLFSSWSDGGAALHTVTTGQDVDLVAHYVVKPPEEPGGEEPPSSGGDGSGSSSLPAPVSSEPPAVPPPGKARVALASKPPGLQLRVGSLRSVAPFALELAIGTKTFLAAPAQARKNGKVLRFQRWMKGSRNLGSSRRRELTVDGSAKYVAVYAVSRQGSAGGR
ncbi:MAG TPA: PQQ-dependent sugar dehydrogenase, partial [Solirubrobacterales bacterium]|nr:PQQ-dependent sugar dehydrogenase [Solirubrobacterales bacterium]